MAGTSYTRQSTFDDGDVVTAALFNNEYNKLLNAFVYASTGTTGHQHDGGAGEGGNIEIIGDQDFLNKLVVDTDNNRWGFFVQVSSSAVEQIRIQDGAIVPVTDNDIDLGTSSLKFKDLYIDGTAYVDAIDFNGTAISATAAELNIMDGVTSTATELNLLDGVTSTTAELNILDGVTSTAAELNILDGVTSTASELNILDGVTATATELNLIDGVTATTDELNILDGVTASTADINLIDGITNGTVIASKVVITDANKDISGGRNITISGELDAGSLDVSGNADIDGTLETDALSLNGTAVTSTAAELNILDGVTSTAVELNILDGVTSTTSELNTLDGITAVVGELNALDIGSTAVGTAVASKAVILDSDKDYTGIRNLTITGDLTIGGDDLIMGTNTAGMLLVADGTNFNPTAVSSLSEISTVASDDVFLAIDTSGGGLKKISRSAVVSGLATSSGISNIVEDTSPQLGGNLDVNGNDLISLSNATIDLAPHGTGTVVVRGNTNSGAIVLNCEDNSHGQKIYGQPHSASVTNTLMLPAGADSTLVSLVSTDTLTNKTLTSPKINEDVAVTSTATELNLLDGVTSTTAELNILDGVTSTAAELNILDGVTSTAAELNALDGITAVVGELNALDIGSTAVGTAVASKAVILDSNKDYTGVRNFTVSGELDAATGDFSGDVDIDGTLETDALSINGTAVTSTAAELNILDGVTSTAAELNILDGVTSTAAELNILDGVTSTAAELNALDGITAVVGELNALDIGSTAVGTAVASKAVILDSNKDYTGVRNLTISGELDAGSLDISGDADIDGTLETDALSINGTAVTSTAAELNILDGVTSTAAELNILDGVTSTAAELNILDGVTSTAAELNILDGVTSTAAELNQLDGVVAKTAGKETIWVPATAMSPTTSNPCSDLTIVETTSGRPDMIVLDFDKDADEFAQFSVAFPKSWNLGTVTFQVFWAGIAATTDCDWSVDAVAMNDNETIDVAFGTAVVVTDNAQGAVEELLVSAESGALTIAGTPADNDLCFFRVGRDVSGDAMAGDARLIGIKLFFTTDLANDG